MGVVDQPPRAMLLELTMVPTQTAVFDVGLLEAAGAMAKQAAFLQQLLIKVESKSAEQHLDFFMCQGSES